MLETEKNKFRKVFRARRFRRLRDVVWHCFNEAGRNKASLILSHSLKSFKAEIIMPWRKDLFLFEIRNFSMSNHQVIHKSSFKSVSEQFWCVRVSLKGETVGDFLWRGFLESGYCSIAFTGGSKNLFWCDGERWCFQEPSTEFLFLLPF